MQEVEKTTQDASTETEVEKTGADTASAAKDETSTLELLAKTLEKLEKAEADRDNYKLGMLKAKGKASGDESEGEGEDGQEVTKPAPSDAVTKQLIREVQELKTAMLNKSQTGGAGSGQGASTESTMKVSDNMLSEEQIANLRARGWDDKKIARFKTNLLRAKTA